MSNIIDFNQYKIRKILFENYNPGWEINEDYPAEPQQPKIRTWDDLTTEEKKKEIFAENLYLPDYIKYASMQCYCKRFVKSDVYIESYEEWIHRMLQENTI